jgi:hypothetical protein
MGSALEAIEKKGYFKTHKGSDKVYVEQHELVKQAKMIISARVFCFFWH